MEQTPIEYAVAAVILAVVIMLVVAIALMYFNKGSKNKENKS